MKKYLVPAAILAAAFAASLLAPRGRPADDRDAAATVQWPAMGTVAGISFRGADARARDAARETVQARYARLENLLSAWKPDSELSRLSAKYFASAHGTPARAETLAALLAEASPETRPCYEAAFRLCALSGGAFNPVIGAAMRETGFSRVSNLDLGGIAKGFAVDRAWEDVAKGGTGLLLDLGGNLRAAGPEPWRTGIRNPFDRNAIAATLALANGDAVATSGNYERFTVKNGTRVSHILDGRDGKPCSGTAAVTVLYPGSAMMADGLSTALFVLGPAAGARMLEKHFPEACALWMPDTPEAPQILATRGMMARLKDVRFALSEATAGER